MNNDRAFLQELAVVEKPSRQRLVLVLVLLVTLLVAYLDRVNVAVLVADDDLDSFVS